MYFNSSATASLENTSTYYIYSLEISSGILLAISKAIWALHNKYTIFYISNKATYTTNTSSSKSRAVTVNHL